MKKLFLIVLCVFCAFGCVKKDDVVVHSVSDVEVLSSSKAKITLDVENNSSSKVAIKEMNLLFEIKDKEFMKIIMKDKLEIPRKSEGKVSTVLAYKIYNPLAVLSLLGGGSFAERFFREMTVTGEVKLKAGISGKKLKFEKVSFKQILATFGISSDDIIKNLDL